jgi:hypothetical protein
LNSSYLPNFKHLGIVDPPFLGHSAPIYKDSDPLAARAQDTPFFNSVQFRLWNEGELTNYNKLIDVLVKWRDRGWCEFNEVTEWIAENQNWIAWIKYSALIQVPAEELHHYLYEMNILNMPMAADSSKDQQEEII